MDEMKKKWSYVRNQHIFFLQWCFLQSILYLVINTSFTLERGGVYIAVKIVNDLKLNWASGKMFSSNFIEISINKILKVKILKALYFDVIEIICTFFLTVTTIPSNRSIWRPVPFSVLFNRLSVPFEPLEQGKHFIYTYLNKQ